MQHRAAGVANSLPAADALEEVKADEPEVEEALSKVAAELRGVLGELTGLREQLLTQRGVEVEDDDSEEGEEEKEEKDEGSDDEEADEPPRSSRKRQRAGGDEEWAAIEQSYAASQPFWHATVATWQRRAQLGGAAANKRKFKVVNQDIFDQVDASLQDRTRAMRKAHPVKGEVAVIGAGDGDSAAAAAAAASPASKVLEYEIFDDREFYHQQLKEFLESRGAGGADRAADALAVARKRRSKRSGVDPKASKGRKLRYDTHPKVRMSSSVASHQLSVISTPATFYSCCDPHNPHPSSCLPFTCRIHSPSVHHLRHSSS